MASMTREDEYSKQNMLKCPFGNLTICFKIDLIFNVEFECNFCTLDQDRERLAGSC